MRDPYSVLGVKRDAAANEIKAAWRTKAKTVHPDQNRDDPSASARFTEIGQAYDLLKDPKKRDLYDQARRAAERKQREQTIMQQREEAREAAERAKAAEKLMEELAKAEASKPRTETPGATADASASVKPETPEDMLERIFGAQARKYAKAQSQPQDSASHDGKGTAEADDANGSSEEKAAQASFAATAFFTSIIRRIRGTQLPPEKAPDITAEAVVTVSDFLERKWMTVTLPDEREVRFQIEPGMKDGHIVRLKGQGLKLPGIARGDLAVTLLAARDDAFTIRDFDIHTTLPLSLQDAVLGCDTIVQSPNGEVNITIPAWSGSDRSIRVEGKGLPKEDSSYGDFVVELRIVLLEKPDEKVTDLMRLMREGLFL
jgi:DnaJ-class molecular chaperone